MSEDFDKYLAVANHDIQMAKNMGELKSYVASILYDNDKKIDMIHELEEEIKEYQKALDEITSEKIDLDNIIKEAITILKAMKHCEILVKGKTKTNIDKLLDILGSDKE